jgi:NADH-quinone oxidoreductase subunit L
MPSSYLWLIPLLPFTGFLINGTVGRKLPRPVVTAVALLFTAAPAALVAWLWAGVLAGAAPISVVSAPWISISGLTVNFAFTVDHLTAIMLAVVTGVGFLIHLYSAGYMAHEDGFWRFFAYLNLFMFFMLVLVLSSSFLLLFVGWEGVGLASYLLIGFYFKKDSAANAGKKAFVVNRIGDFGFLLAMFLIIAHFGTLDFATVFNAANHILPTGGHVMIGNVHAPGIYYDTIAPSTGFITTICLLLVVGAAGKSAQIPLYVWLPDAMEGPTPVSALIHAATMVTAGIYMVARCHTLFDRSPTALTVVACIGAATAIFAACIGIVQTDIKRVLAYSTVSQLGYMFLACGVGAYSAGIFHLMTHAFFKALLFLAAGSVIHALSGEQDMRRMGALRKRIPVTFWTMTMGVFAIAGLPPWAAFFSKDEILYRAFISDTPLGKLLWFVGLLTAGMTSFYMFRLWFKTFFGESHVDEHVHGHDDHGGHSNGVHESPWIMLFPLVVLAILSIIGGWVGVPEALGGHDQIGAFLAPVLSGGAALGAEGSRSVELALAAVSVLTALAGLGLAYFFYVLKPGTSTALAARFKPVYTLIENKFYVDEIYSAAIVTPILIVSRLLLGGVIDQGVVNGVPAATSAGVRGLGSLTRRMQSGNIRSYAGWLALGAAAVLVVMIFGQTTWAQTIWMHL